MHTSAGYIFQNYIILNLAQILFHVLTGIFLFFYCAFSSLSYQATASLLFDSCIYWIRDSIKHYTHNSIYTLLKMVGDIYHGDAWIFDACV